VIARFFNINKESAKLTWFKRYVEPTLRESAHELDDFVHGPSKLFAINTGSAKCPQPGGLYLRVSIASHGPMGWTNSMKSIFTYHTPGYHLASGSSLPGGEVAFTKELVELLASGQCPFVSIIYQFLHQYLDDYAATQGSIRQLVQLQYRDTSQCTNLIQLSPFSLCNLHSSPTFTLAPLVSRQPILPSLTS
jgi:hypothetical protein